MTTIRAANPTTTRWTGWRTSSASSATCSDEPEGRTTTTKADRRGRREARGRVRVTDEGFELSGERTPVATLLREIWRARPLIAILARKDFYVKYRRASFGMLWAVGVPVFQTFVLAVIFTRVVKIRTGGDYPVFLFAGQLGWAFFAGVVGGSSTAIVDGSGMASRIYFPRAVLVIEAVAAQLYSFAISVVILLALALMFGVSLGPDVALVVPGILLLVGLTTGLTLLNSALHVYFRDIRYLVTMALSVMFFATPIIYPLDQAPAGLRAVLLANPMTGVVELFRAATVGADEQWLTAIAISCTWAVALLGVALVVHGRYNRVFNDLL